IEPYQLFEGKLKFKELDKNGLEYTYIYTGLFTEFLDWFGFDTKNKKATFYIDGMQRYTPLH
ncbi:38752_t:CDS:1, partial [Gigaspora margarita]